MADGARSGRCCMRGAPPWFWWWWSGGAGDELQRVPRAAEGVQRGVRVAAVPAVDRGRRRAGPRHHLRRQVLRPRRPHVLPHRRPRPAAPCGVPVAAVRGGGADDQPGERRRGAARGRELAPLPGGRRGRAPRRRHPPDAGARRQRCSRRRRVRLHGEAGGGVLHVLGGEAGDGEGGERGGSAPRGCCRWGAGAAVRPRAMAQPQIPVGARGAAAWLAVDDIGGVRHDDERRRLREGARAAEPFCLMRF